MTAYDDVDRLSTFGLASAVQWTAGRADQLRNPRAARLLRRAEAEIRAPYAPPRRWPFFGHALGFKRDPLRAFRAYADEDLAIVNLGPIGDAYIVTAPDHLRKLVEHGALDKSELYASMRPAFGNGVIMADAKAAPAQRRPLLQCLRSEIGAIAPIVEQAARRAVAEWRALGAFDLGEMCQYYALDVIMNLMEGESPSPAERRQLRLDLQLVLDQGERESWSPCPWIEARTPRGRSARRAADRLRAIAQRIVRAERTGFIRVLKSVHDDDALVADEVTNILLAGHETTGATTAFAFAFARRRPDVWRRLAAGDDAMRDAVVWETLRLRPTIYSVTRRALRPIDLGEATIPKGGLVIFSGWMIHRRRHWKDPDEWIPERWASLDAEAEIKALRYAPFGLPPRACVGDRLALLEIRTLLRDVATSTALEIDQNSDPEAYPAITLRPPPLRARIAA